MPAISTVKIGAKHAGIVKVLLKLSKAAKAALSRNGKLTLTRKVSFTPSGSKTATVRNQKVTITLRCCKPKPARACRAPRRAVRPDMSIPSEVCERSEDCKSGPLYTAT